MTNWSPQTAEFQSLLYCEIYLTPYLYLHLTNLYQTDFFVAFSNKSVLWHERCKTISVWVLDKQRLYLYVNTFSVAIRGSGEISKFAILNVSDVEIQFV
jgi:hypothetical protein